MSASEAKTSSEAPPAQSSDSNALQASGARAKPLAGDDDPSHGTPSGAGSEAPTLKELTAQLVVGTVIDGKYALEAVIGRGGMGVVVSAKHVDLGRDVALKFLCSGEGASTGDMRTRFRREAQISAKLKNEHITRVLDVGAWRNASYIVMERLEGVDLRRKMKNSGGALPLAVALNYTLQVCEGIAEAHAHGIVHRDLKPANLFITQASDSTDLVKIMDFGISKWNGGEIGEITKDGTLLGSPKYMAPEQVFGTKAIDARADIWSIGAILFEMLAGRTPYVETTLARLCAALLEGPPPRLDKLNPEIPSRIADAVAHALDGTASARTQTVADLAGELLDAVDAPGQAMRERLGAILAMRPLEGAGPGSGNLLANLGPVSSSRTSTTPQPAKSDSIPPARSDSSRPPGPPTASTLISPVSVVKSAASLNAVAASAIEAAKLEAQPPAPAKPSRLPLIVAIAVAVIAVAALVITRKGAAPAPTPAAQPPAATMAAPTAAAPTAAAPTATAAQTATATAAQAATAQPTATATAAAVEPPKGARPGGFAPGPRPGAPAKAGPAKEKKGDDDIPTMR